MNQYSIATQIYIGKNEEHLFSTDQIKNKIGTAKTKTNLKSLMIWTQNISKTEKIITTCRQFDIEPYLWFPVLADTHFKPSDSDLVLTCDNQRSIGRTGKWEKLGAGDEEFVFTCPNNQKALDQVFNVYSKLINNLDIDGVMLDRIRYPSFVNGFEALFTCFCDICQRKFKKQFNTSLNIFNDRDKIINFFLKSNIDELCNSDDLIDIWNISGQKKFFNFRNNNIFDIVNLFSSSARKNNLKVGLDLFTPSFSATVGQDYKKLNTICDWIKPMTYCNAIGPSTLPLELSCLARILKSLNPKLMMPEIFIILESITNWKIDASSDYQILENGVPENILRIELEKIKKMHLDPDVKIFPGIEAVKNSEFNINITRKVLEKYLSQINNDNADGIIASWNLLYIEDENFEFIGNYLNQSYGK